MPLKIKKGLPGSSRYRIHLFPLFGLTSKSVKSSRIVYVDENEDARPILTIHGTRTTSLGERSIISIF